MNNSSDTKSKGVGGRNQSARGLAHNRSNEALTLMGASRRRKSKNDDAKFDDFEEPISKSSIPKKGGANQGAGRFQDSQSRSGKSKKQADQENMLYQYEHMSDVMMDNTYVPEDERPKRVNENVYVSQRIIPLKPDEKGTGKQSCPKSNASNNGQAQNSQSGIKPNYQSLLNKLKK